MLKETEIPCKGLVLGITLADKPSSLAQSGQDAYSAGPGIKGPSVAVSQGGWIGISLTRATMSLNTSQH